MHFGPYVVVGGPFEGGFGRVYRAVRPEAAGVFFAVKTVKDPSSAAQRDALGREAKVLARVRHPHVLRLLESRLEDPLPYVVYEYLAGGNLRPYVGRLAEYGVYTVLYCMAGGLGAYHGAGGFHRDVKPDNMLVGPDGNVILGDPGLANIPTNDSPLTRGIAGTPSYIDPGVVNHGYDAAADIYSLAVTAAELLTGLPPQALQGPNGFTLLSAQLPVKASTIHQTALHALLAAMMRPERAFRPSAVVVQQYAHVLLAGGNLPQLPNPQPPRPQPGAGGDVAGALAAGAVVALLTVGLIALLSDGGGAGGGGA